MGLLSVASAMAHHSTAMYDYAKSQQLVGTVKEFKWTNPHMFITVLAPNGQGQDAEWSIECGTPNINARHGWKKTDLMPGDKVSMEIHPMRDGTSGGTLVTVKLADGRTLHGPGGDIAPGAPISAPPGSPPRAPAQ